METQAKIGVRVNDYRTDVKRGLQLAGAQRFNAVELSADAAELAPRNLAESGRRHLARLVAQTGMTFAALGSEAAGGGLADPARVDALVAATRDALRLAADMRVPVFTHDVGELHGLTEGERDGVTDALRTLAAEAERVGTIYAVRSRLCTPDALAGLVETVDCPLVKLSVDPGALLMAGFDPLAALERFGEQVVLAYVRDAQRGDAEHPGRETALAAGRLDLPAYLAHLSASGCASTPILRRAQALNPAADLAADRERFLSYLAE